VFQRFRHHRFDYYHSDGLSFAGCVRAVAVEIQSSERPGYYCIEVGSKVELREGRKRFRKREHR
jgi:hypothetical protein